MKYADFPNVRFGSIADIRLLGANLYLNVRFRV